MAPQATIAALYGNFSASFLAPFARGGRLCGVAVVSSGMAVANGRFPFGPHLAHLANLAQPTSPERNLFALVGQRLLA